jgi:hypothetical protein
MNIPSVTMTWILAGLTIAIGILGLVMNFFSVGIYTVPAIIALVIGVLTLVLNYLTNNTVKQLYTQLKRLKK